MEDELFPESGDGDPTAGPGFRRALLLTPALAVVAAVVYLAAGSPAVDRLFASGPDAGPRGVAIAPTRPLVVTPVPAHAAGVVAVVPIPPGVSGFLTGEPVVPPVPPVEVWQWLDDERTLDGVDWEAGPPSAKFVGPRDGEYYFRVEGFLPHERLLLDRVTATASVDGRSVHLRVLGLAARREGDGALVSFRVEGQITGGPGLQVIFRGSLGSAAFTLAPPAASTRRGDARAVGPRRLPLRRDRSRPDEAALPAPSSVPAVAPHDRLAHLAPLRTDAVDRPRRLHALDGKRGVEFADEGRVGVREHDAGAA